MLKAYQKNQSSRILTDFNSWRLQKIVFFGFFGTLSRDSLEKIGFFGTLSAFSGFETEIPKRVPKKPIFLIQNAMRVLKNKILTKNNKMISKLALFLVFFNKFI